MTTEKKAPVMKKKPAGTKKDKKNDPALGFMNCTVTTKQGKAVKLKGIAIRDNDFRDPTLLAMLAAAKRDEHGEYKTTMEVVIRVNTAEEITEDSF